MVDAAILGHRIRHFRTASELTLDALGERIGLAGSQLSLIENGHREPKLSHLQAIAEVLGVSTAQLLEPEPPSERSRMELDLQRLQEGASYRRLGLPLVRPTRSMSDDLLSALVGMHRELDRRAREAIATPEQARRDATALRHRMREQANALPELEDLAEEQLRAVGYEGGSLTHRTVSEMAARLGFELVYVTDLPHSTRSVTDLENGRIYLPPASIPGGHGLRSMALQALAHRLLGHHEPQDYSEFLQQRLEINYFAAATLMPRSRAVEYLRKAKKERNLAVEDFRDAFGVTHETAAMRFTNLATTHLDLRVHFLRVGEDGALSRVYENDGIPIPVDASDHAEGQLVCRKFARQERVRAHVADDGVLPVHRHPQRHLLVLDADRHGRRRGVLHLVRRAVRRRQVLPRVADRVPRGLHLPGRSMLRPARRRPRRPLAPQVVGVGPHAPAHPRAAAVGHLPGRGRRRAVRLPRAARAGHLTAVG